MPPTSSTLAGTQFDPNSNPKMTRFFKKSELLYLYPYLDLGDRVEFGRGVFEHLAIYVGPGEINGEWCCHRIVHFETPQDVTTLYLLLLTLKLPFLPSLLTIQMTKIAPHVGELGVRINNSMDSILSPLPSEEIVRRAEEFLLQQHSQRYNCFFNNCHHLANSCRYGEAYSESVTFYGLIFVLAAVDVKAIDNCFNMEICLVTLGICVLMHQLSKYLRGESDDGFFAKVDKIFRSNIYFLDKKIKSFYEIIKSLLISLFKEIKIACKIFNNMLGF